MDHKTKNLLFLFAAAPMGMTGCLGGGDDSDSFLTLTSGFTTNNSDDTSGDGDGDNGTSGDGDGDGDSTGDGDGDGDPTTGDGDGDSGDGDGDSTGDGDGDGDSTGDGDGDGDSTGDGDGDDTDTDTGAQTPEELCMVYSELIGMCYGDENIQGAYMTCLYYHNQFEMNGPGCVAAFEEFLVCISVLSCADFETIAGCEAEQAEFANECG